MKNSDYKILLVDDEPDILEFVSYNIKKEEYQVYTADNGLAAIELARELQPHLIILDVMMPEMDGMETCKELKQIPSLNNTIIIFLTARSEDYSQIAGFEAGADDYVTKPIKPGLLISKIKALLRRYSGIADDTVEYLKAGPVTIDKERYIVLKENEEIVLPKKEFELLNLLASKPNKVFSREEIFARVWGNNVVVGDRTIDVHVRKLREKIGIELIKTVKGVGYKFEV
jgi:two-component system, OmpR family, alkaline phosphatase synthesis response regulator PhoP